MLFVCNTFYMLEFLNIILTRTTYYLVENLFCFIIVLYYICLCSSFLNTIFKKKLDKYLLEFLRVSIVFVIHRQCSFLNILLKRKLSKYPVWDISVVSELFFLLACEIITEPCMLPSWRVRFAYQSLSRGRFSEGLIRTGLVACEFQSNNTKVLQFS